MYALPNIYDINPEKQLDEYFKLGKTATKADYAFANIWVRGYKTISVYPFVEGYSAKVGFLDSNKQIIGSYSGSLSNFNWSTDFTIPDGAYFCNVYTVNAYSAGSSCYAYYSIGV